MIWIKRIIIMYININSNYENKNKNTYFFFMLLPLASSLSWSLTEQSFSTKFCLLLTFASQNNIGAKINNVTYHNYKHIF